MPAYPLLTERLALRPIVATDTAALLAYRSQPDVCRYLPFEPQGPADIERNLAGPWRTTELTDAGQALNLAVERRADGRLIGDVVLFYTDVTHHAGEIGYVFAPSVAGRGYATEAAARLLDVGFDEVGMHRIVARLDARNAASAGVCTRLGMRQEAHFRENEWFRGEWTDELVFAVLAEDWRALRAAR